MSEANVRIHARMEIDERFGFLSVLSEMYSDAHKGDSG